MVPGDGGRERGKMTKNGKYKDAKISKSSVDGVNSLQFPAHCVSLGDCSESESKLLGEDNCISGVFLSSKLTCLWLVSPASSLSLSLRPTNHLKGLSATWKWEEAAKVSFNFRVLGIQK